MESLGLGWLCASVEVLVVGILVTNYWLFGMYLVFILCMFIKIMSTYWFAATAKIWNNGLYFRREGQKGIPQEVCCLLILCDIISTFLIVLVLCSCIASINHLLFLFLCVFKNWLLKILKNTKTKKQLQARVNYEL